MTNKTLKYYIFLNITEIMLKCYENTGFSRYIIFINYFKISIYEDKLNKKEFLFLNRIETYLKINLGLNQKQVYYHLLEYINSNEIEDFENLVKLNNKVFNYTGIITKKYF